jgi:PAS domain S-box-containing protein
MSEQFLSVSGSSGEVTSSGKAASDSSDWERLLLLEALVEQIPDAVLVADSRGVLVEVNASACQLLGYNQEELTGKSISDLIAPEDQPERITIQSGRELEKTSSTRTFLHRDGGSIQVEVHTKTLSGDR